jgi:hypothetical protein
MESAHQAGASIMTMAGAQATAVLIAEALS